ncbi:hypothetical protein BB778_09995 [Pluralibacter gergoviae]|uniref:hypothetical protein n=1 Tax=Pluralibacter gergoviae TaxID=61647 RepID=UPI0008DC0ACE|nr:hypothetical protein [Pluralibacter gergoviae]OHY69517.1 hypothetical protein BB778_09995 [Pluralibacter gergoviae]
MRKSLMLLGGVVIVLFVTVIYAWSWIKMEFAGSAYYTESDKREYNFYTPDVLKKIPRITPRYSFDFANITGPAAHVHSVKFYGSLDTGKIEGYLSGVGYRRYKCDFDTTCWRKNDPKESIYIDALTGEETVIVQVVYHF